jgi:hypothetical protein
MRVTIATRAATPGRANEDYAVATDDLVVLLDGATVPDGMATGCSHGTRWFARQLGAGIFAGLSRQPERSLADGAAEAIEQLAAWHGDGRGCDIKHPNHTSAAIAVLRERADEFQYFVLSDAVIVLDTTDGVRVITDDRLPRAATDHRRAFTATTLGTSENEVARTALIDELRRLRNTEEGFWVATSDPEAARHAVTGSIARSRVRRAAVLSDGASSLVDRFNLATWTELLSTMANDGPHALIRRIRAAERSDPNATRWPRAKTHDDATAVLCTPE